MYLMLIGLDQYELLFGMHFDSYFSDLFVQDVTCCLSVTIRLKRFATSLPPNWLWSCMHCATFR
jgi:hypothetical protein